MLTSVLVAVGELAQVSGPEMAVYADDFSGDSDGVIVYHARKDLWDATVGEELPCQSEHGNAQDALFNGSLDLERLIQPLSILLAS